MPVDSFHPTIRRWFRSRFGEPTAPQERGWPSIRTGRHTLIAAPTGSGKTLAAFLSAIDSLLREGRDLPDATKVLYVSPLKALGNDVQRNLQGPLGEIRGDDASLPEVRVLVRSGDTTAGERDRMRKRPPHILVTTPESLYILLTSDGGRRMLATVTSVIVDEIHAILGDKRGSHLALSLERLEALAGPVQRIGLSATQKPLEDVGRFLVGAGRSCELVDEGHLRKLDLEVEIPPSPLQTVCPHETWEEIYGRIAELIRGHKTTLVFAGTRKLSERISAQLSKLLGEDVVACHHSSISKERRLDAEARLKAGRLRAMVATASLELGIDIGDVDLVIQIGATPSIATLLQRVGRAGHVLHKVPKGRLFPLTPDELIQCAALLRSVRTGLLDRTPQPTAPLDILAQQLVASCVAETWDEDRLFERFRRAWPYRELPREDFDAVVALHSSGRRALIHHDGVGRRLRGTRRARLVAVTSGGAIPDRADYRVVLEPEGIFVGSLDEDFAIESSAGDIFQLGNASWRILGVGRGVVRVADAKGQPPTLPFWFGEAPARTPELSGQVGDVRENGDRPGWIEGEASFSPASAVQAREYLEEGKRSLGAVPTPRRVVLERFFDESGGMQLVIHAPFGGRINRAWGLALRKRFCRHFGFELQAAANEDAILLSLGLQHSFPLEEVFDYLNPETARHVLTQALLPTPMFMTRWRWNIGRALILERTSGGKRVAAPLLRMRADDLLAQAFPQVLACGETLPPGDIAVPLDHPMVRQTVEDCLHEAMDIEGLVEVLRGLRDGRIEKHAVDTPEPSAFARSILSARPYSFLDDAPLEERRTQAVLTRRALDPATADRLGALDPDAVRRVREEAWPQPSDAEEVHEALLWMGYATEEEARPWAPWIRDLADQRRIALDDGRWFAVEATRDPKEVLRGRLEALGPVVMNDPLLFHLENDGAVLRIRFDGRRGWCDRRLLARIHRYTLDRLRREIEPVSPAEFLRFLARWHHVDPQDRLEGPAGVAHAARQLAGFECPAGAWERSILPNRINGYRPEWLDDLTLRGELVWGRLWGSGASSLRSTPLCFVPREDMPSWEGLSGPPLGPALSTRAQTVRDLLASRGAMFNQDLDRASGLLPSHLEMALGELVALGLATNDSFASLRALLLPSWKRKARRAPAVAGRWSLFRRDPYPPTSPEFIAEAMLRRWGVVFRRILTRERQPVPWRDLVGVYRRMELRGDVRGGRFVGGFAGEQYARPEAVDLMRRVRREGPRDPVMVTASDPLNLRGILTPDERIPSGSKRTVRVV